MVEAHYDNDRTALYRVDPDGQTHAGRVLQEVYRALVERGYDPVNQIVGYLLSGDPTYITAHRGARGLIRGVRRDELLEELVRRYVESQAGTRPSR